MESWLEYFLISIRETGFNSDVLTCQTKSGQKDVENKETRKSKKEEKLQVREHIMKDKVKWSEVKGSWTWW